MDLIARSVLVLSAALNYPASATEPPKPYGVVPNLRQLKWHGMEMYAFAHFGPGTFNDVEWGSGAEKVTDFTHSDLDAGQIVRVAKAGGMTYLTRQDGNPNGKIDKYGVEASTDGKTWKVVTAGEFPNIQANSIEQVVKFPNEVTTRYLRFTAEQVVASDHMAVAELGVIEADAK